MYLIQIHGLYSLSRVLWLWRLQVKKGRGVNGRGLNGGGRHTGKHCPALPFRSSLPESALLEDNAVCYCACSWTPGCLDHLLQLAAPKTGRCSVWAANRTTVQRGTQAAQNGKKSGTKVLDPRAENLFALYAHHQNPQEN